MPKRQNRADQIGVPAHEQFCYGRQLLKILDDMRQDPEVMAKIKARIEENQRKAALAN